MLCFVYRDLKTWLSWGGSDWGCERREAKGQSGSGDKSIAQIQAGLLASQKAEAWLAKGGF